MGVICGAARSGMEDLFCVLDRHDDGHHEDVNGDTWTTAWMPVPGWPCWASEAGQIQGPSGQILKPYVGESGHLHVLIRHKKLRVHHAVLMAFGFRRPEGMECRHLDGNPANNNLNNLAWGTRLENARDKARHGTERHGEDKVGHRLTAEQVLAIRRDPRASRKVGADYGVSHTAVLRIRRGERWRRAV